MNIPTSIDPFADNQSYTCHITHSHVSGNSNFHTHNYYEIFLLIEGNIHYYVNQSCFHMKSGDLLVVNKNVIHKAINLTNEPFRRLVIHIHPDLIRKFSTLHTNLYHCFHLGNGANQSISLSSDEYEDLQQLGTKLVSLQEELRSYGKDVYGELLLIDILIKVNQQYRKVNPKAKQPSQGRIKDIMTYIDAHLTDELTLDGIAHAVSIDKYHLSHIFKQETQSTIFQYIVAKRVSYAKELMQQGHTVTEACQSSGFNDYTNFIRTFKKVTGYTPGKYRKIYYV